MLAVAKALIVGGNDVEPAGERRDQVAILVRRRWPAVEQNELGVLRVTGFAIGDAEAVNLDRAVTDLRRRYRVVMTVGAAYAATDMTRVEALTTTLKTAASRRDLRFITCSFKLEFGEGLAIARRVVGGQGLGRTCGLRRGGS